jgi:soluble lytic murein transglycosylase
MIYFNGARYQEALDAFEEAHKRGEKSDPDLWMARRLRHWLLYRLERYDDAVERFAKMGGTLRGRNSYAIYWRARSLQKRAEQSGPEVKRLTATLEELKGELNELQDKERARKKSPKERAKVRAMSRAERKAQARALRQTKREIKSTQRELKRAERRLKRAPRDVEEALALFKRIIERAPTSYYAYVSAARLREAGEVVSVPWREHPQELQGHLPEVPPIPDPLTTLRPFAQSYGGDLSGWEAVYGLALIGERRWAAIWLRSLFEEHKAYHRASGARRARWAFAPKFYLDYRDDTEYGIWGEREPLKAPRERAWARALRAERPTQLFHKLEGAFRGLDDHYYGRRVSHYEGPKLSYPEAPGERAEWARRYPRSFRSEVEESAARYGVDPYLIWALMTVESSHNPWAISRVGARGLMQVMPHTGQLSADRLAWPYFGSPLLFEPEVAVEMAAWYFKELSDNFHGQLPLAMAAYNAGPHRVKVWLEFKGELPLDELIEEIPYAQAREYAKKVTRHLALYRRIYEGHTGHLLNLKLNPAVKGNINF